MPRALALLVVAILGCSKDPAGTGAEVTRIRVGAAANLTRAFAELGARFHAETGITAVMDYGSSGLLARQLKEGAPLDVFASANEAFVDDVIAAGACDAATRVLYARAPIVVWVKAGGVAAPADLAGLADPRFGSIAIANPQTAPYGKAAQQAFENAGIWAQVAPRIKYGENIAQTLKYAQTGNVDAAIVASSLVVDDQGGTAVPIPGELHDPIDQAMVVCARGAAATAAKRFVDYVVSEEGRAIMTRFGYTAPGAISRQ